MGVYYSFKSKCVCVCVISALLSLLLLPSHLRVINKCGA